MCYDRLGDGCKVNFPISLYSKIQWLPVVYTKDECGMIVPKKENCVIYQLVKYVVDFYLVFISIYHTICHWSLTCMEWQSICNNYTCTGVLSIELLQIIKSLHCLIKRSASGRLSFLGSLPIGPARERRNMVSTIIYINTREGAPSEVIFWKCGAFRKAG